MRSLITLKAGLRTDIDEAFHLSKPRADESESVVILKTCRGHYIKRILDTSRARGVCFGALPSDIERRMYLLTDGDTPLIGTTVRYHGHCLECLSACSPESFMERLEKQASDEWAAFGMLESVDQRLRELICSIRYPEALSQLA